MSTHAPLSERLKSLAHTAEVGGDLTINTLVERTNGRGLYLVIILLSLPFILPVSIPGTSIIFGPAVALLSLRIAFGRNARLPAFIGNRRLSGRFRDAILTGGIQLLKGVEKVARPRRTRWLTTRAARLVNGLILTFLGILLAMPFPPLPPLTNTLPCYSIILLSTAMMEEDGVLVWWAYIVAIGTTLYLVLVAGAIEAGFSRLWDWLVHMVAS